MGQRKERQSASAALEIDLARTGVAEILGEQNIARQVIHRQHNAFRRPRGARGVVEQNHPIVGHLAELNVPDAEARRILVVEHRVETVHHAAQAALLALVHDAEVGQIESALQRGHAVDVQRLPEIVAREEQSALGVIHYVDHVGGIKILKYGHDDGAVRHGSDVGDAPTHVVATYERDLVALGDTRVLEQDMQPRHLLGHTQIRQRLAAEIVGQGRQGAVFAKTRLVHPD